MVDLHCHILPGIDDGPADIQESVRMAEMAADDGIRRIVATPHVRDETFSVREIRARIDELNALLAVKGIPVEILRGADVSAFLDISLLRDCTINNTNYVLIEFPGSHMPLHASAIIFRMVAGGYRPIVTHPERNLSVLRNPDILNGLEDAGALIQITAGSLTGDFGPEIRDCALHLLSMKIVALLATDAHSSTWRPPALSRGVEAAGRVLGRGRASLLVNENPGVVLAGGPVRAMRGI